MITGTNPMSRETLALNIRRDRMSRPFRSVPRRKRGSGCLPQDGSDPDVGEDRDDRDGEDDEEAQHGRLVAPQPVERVEPEAPLLPRDDVQRDGALLGGGDGRHYLATLIRGTRSP